MPGTMVVGTCVSAKGVLMRKGCLVTCDVTTGYVAGDGMEWHAKFDVVGAGNGRILGEPGHNKCLFAFCLL